jgi:hypothetical protein
MSVSFHQTVWRNILEDSYLDASAMRTGNLTERGMFVSNTESRKLFMLEFYEIGS